MWTYNYNQSDILQHYGILGMKWGIRRFQDKNGNLTSAGKKRYSEKNPKSEKEESFFEKKTGIHLTDNQKKAIKVGVTVAGIALAAYGGYRLYNSDVGKPVRDYVDGLIYRFNENIDRETFKNTGKLTEHAKQDLSTRDYDSKLHFFKKAREYTPEEDLKAINEGMLLRKKGAQNNCGLCTTAYELRRRGYDVRANFSEEGRSVSTLANMFKNAEVKNDSKYLNMKHEEWVNKIVEDISSQGEGARGNFGGHYSTGGGHSIIYEVVNGKVIFRDGQLGKNYSSPSEALNFFTPGKSSYFRTDNLEINENTIRDAVSTFGLPRVNTNLMESDPEIARAIREEIVATRRRYKQIYNQDISLNEVRNMYRTRYGLKV